MPEEARKIKPEDFKALAQQGGAVARIYAQGVGRKVWTDLCRVAEEQREENNSPFVELTALQLQTYIDLYVAMCRRAGPKAPALWGGTVQSLRFYLDRAQDARA